MNKIEWTEDYSVGHAELDAQHRVLIEMVNSLIEVDAMEYEQEAIATIIGQLTDYAATHFGDEERLMAQSSYSGYEAHCLEHDAFRRKNEELHLAAQQEEGRVVEEIITYLRTWVVDHILGSDMDYRRSLGG